MKKLGIIIVTYNSEKDIYDCIGSIKKWADIPQDEIELIVVDNNSSGCDTMFERLKTMWDGIVLIKNSTNGGYGQGNNLGIRQCSAPVVLIMNPDVRLLEPTFKKPLDAFAADSRLCIYGMKQMLTENEPSPYPFTCTYMMNGYVSTLRAAVCTRLDIYIQKYMHFSGSCFFINKAMFEAVGLFDESVFLYGEEDDIHYRLMHRFSDCRMTYDKHLHYIHLIKEREPDLAYEKKLVDVAVVQNLKKGYSEHDTLKNRLRKLRILIFRERLHSLTGRKNEKVLAMLTGLRQYVVQKMKSH